MSKEKVPWGIGLYLLDGPLTLEEIRTNYEKNPFPSSQQSRFYTKGTRHRRRLERLPDDLAGLIQVGWVIQESGRYALTASGHEQLSREAANAQSYLEEASRRLRTLFQPEVASKVTLIIQIFLAAIKLPAGLLSGSVGLLNDSIDTILDLLSSLLVYLGIRFDRERLVSILLVIFMLVTGGFTLYEAVHRFFTPYIPKVDWFPFAAAVLSALAGFLLWTYQRYIGVRNELMAFIAESVDSRNHVIVALAVMAGLVASLLHFGLLDMLVGLTVAILILWSAIELAIDLVRFSGNGKVDLSQYGFWLQHVYEHGRTTYLRDWMLSMVDDHEVQTRDELASHIRQAIDFRDNPWLKSVGLNRQLATDLVIDQSVDELFSGGWVVDQAPLMLSQKGKEHIEQQTRRGKKRFALISQ
jgi:Co/Zn/Cd efflux system component